MEYFLTHPPYLSLKNQGRGISFYHSIIYTLHFLLKGRVKNNK
jgi:hypothetical protein